MAQKEQVQDADVKLDPPGKKQVDFTGLKDSDCHLQAIEINAWFGSAHVIKDIDFPIAKNKVTAIIGPSGCGKSTFIRMLNRMHEMVLGARYSGKVLLDGQDIYESNVNPVMVRKKIGMMFQKPSPFPMMSIKDNVLAGYTLQGIRLPNKMEMVERSLKQAALWDELKDDLDKSGTSLSGGQQQRLCIARSLAVEPEVLLMDEPCSSLDPIATTKIEELIFQLKKDYTIVIVTHNMQQAARVSDYTAFFYLGELVEYDATEKIFTNPSIRKTEDYVTGRFG